MATTKTVTGIVTWLKGWFYDKDEITTKENALQTQINNKASTADLNTTNTNVSSLQSRVAALESFDWIVITDDKGTASANTMNRLYIEVGDNNTDAYYTVEEEGTYSWSSLDTDILDSLTIDWDDIQNKPSTYYTHPSYTARTGKPTANQTPAFGGSVTISQITSDNTGHVTGATDRTITIPSSVVTQSANGLCISTDKAKLDKSMTVAYGAVGGTTSAYTVTLTGVTLTAGTVIALYNAVGANAASATLNVNNLGAKPIYYNASAIGASRFPNKSVCMFVYNTTIVSTGCWQMIYSYDSNTTYNVATTSANGLMSSSDKSKLDGITDSADSVSFTPDLTSGTKIGTITINGTDTDLYCETDTDTVYTHPSYTARTGKPTANQTPAFGGSVTISQITSDNTGHVTGATDRTITIPSTTGSATVNGLCKTIDGMTKSSYTAGEALSAYQGYLLNTNKSAKSETVDWDEIEFLAKSEDNTGAIKLTMLG